VSVSPIRLHFVAQRNFAEHVLRLFSRSMLPSDSLSAAGRWLGQDAPRDLTHRILENLDGLLEPYLLLSDDTRVPFLSHFRTWRRVVEVISKTEFVFAPPTRFVRAEAFALNFEAVRIKLVIAAGDRGAAFDPFALHAPGCVDV
jgi:hypothetical protein